MIKAHVIIKGRVQGVWFRQSTCDEAHALGLAGWVRNRSNGDVEAVFEGEEAVVERMIAWCRRGPPLAEVVEVQLTRGPAEGMPKPFEKRPSA